jgi:hypothetical protein
MGTATPIGYELLGYENPDRLFASFFVVVETASMASRILLKKSTEMMSTLPLATIHF